MYQIITKYYKTKFGELILGSYREELCLCDWRYRSKRLLIDSRLQKVLKAHYVLGESEVINRCIEQLEEYFNYKRRTFSIPLLLVGSDFQKRVWNVLLDIPFGKTTTYLKQAELLGNKKSVRAVANANGANSIAIIIPCHRVIGSKGELTGYAGGLRTKQKLLDLEQDLFII
ncbi:methylated-DNA--[protein]-cysteine S-methyltransferase [Thiospirochaeta perfilievii]|uniref:Methylated-DNA--protein-cysteine methyltransferase n=1 Tax=Thiospirochaeta perfilievii TaxID=252967 RepID=A0A5C1Q987_9SPIO|nr:methylated-DNA--[protein]-cysteine S-methyltransferase [Thiospirochaeta perfilievii]QEN04673.1 methylated-DNA--[protein]-cysteine S-methyltransferase [Thiospirochaeta perfilievii]